MNITLNLVVSMLFRLGLFCLLIMDTLALSACAVSELPASGKDSNPSAIHAKSLSAGSERGNVGKPTPFLEDAEKRKIYFSPGGAGIDNEGDERIRANAQKLKEDSQLIVTLVGHTDNLGSTAYNLAVADRRIESVINRLRGLGVPRNQIRRLPLGNEESNKIKCDSENCRRLMRKVEFVYERR